MANALRSGGCQLQSVPYAKQLLHKARTVDLAYQRFSGLQGGKVPGILPTIGSPKQWGYRTKITPHFDAPPKWAQRPDQNEEDANDVREWSCRIGFDRKGKPGVLDIEECPIATPVLNAKLIDERQRIKETIWSFKRGATVLLRDSLPAPEPIPTAESPYDPASSTEVAHVAITNHKELVYERVGSFLFSFAAGSFFQNNNSILIPLTEYVKEAIFPPGSTAKRPTHLVDTYCGSGLFGITLSTEFERVAGVEITADSITAAKKNAAMNGLQDKTTWLCGKAEQIFGGLPEQGFAGDHSCVVIDPPRKGCDTPFLEQLLAFKPLTAVYVSCNVHTQARDIGWFITESEKRGEGKWRYELESLRGFDLFPQTAHVESVGVLRLVELN
jgi:tRNA (uracil-5-)-methyltransferase